MGSETITLNANKRDVLGSKVRALRAEGQTPAVIHDHGKDSHHIVVEERELKKVFSAAGKHHPVVLKVDGKSFTTLIKEVTFKPATSIVYHTVFQAVKANETVKTEVPINLIGEEVPAEIAGLLVLQELNTIEVEALPRDLIDAVEVDHSTLTEAGDKIHVSDLKIPSNVTLLTDPEAVVAAVTVPKDQIAEADAAAAELAEDAGATDEETPEGADTSAEGGGTNSGEGADAHDVQPTDEKA